MSSKEEKKSRKDEVLDKLEEAVYSAIEDFTETANGIIVNLPSTAIVDQSDGETKDAPTPLSVNNMKLAIAARKMALSSALDLTKKIDDIEKRRRGESDGDSKKSPKLKSDEQQVSSVSVPTPESSAT